MNPLEYHESLILHRFAFSTLFPFLSTAPCQVSMVLVVDVGTFVIPPERKNNEWEPEANKRHKGGSSMPKLQLIDLTHVQAMLDYRKALIAKIEYVFQGAKPEDNKHVPVSALQTEFLKARLFALSAEPDKCREMAKVLDEYLVMLPGFLGSEPTYRLRDRNQVYLHSVYFQ